MERHRETVLIRDADGPVVGPLDRIGIVGQAQARSIGDRGWVTPLTEGPSGLLRDQLDGMPHPSAESAVVDRTEKVHVG